MGERTSRGMKWSSLLLYVLVIPAAFQLLSRLDEFFEFSGVIGRLLRAWSAFIHGLWDWLLALLPQWIELSANQIDALTWCAAMIGAMIFSFGGAEPEDRASQFQAAILFWPSFAIVAAIFLAPYISVGFYSSELVRTRRGETGLDPSVFFAVGCWLLAVGLQVRAVLRYRERHADQPMVPLWTHLEQAVGTMLLAGLTGMWLGLPELESREAAASAVDLASKGMSIELLWERLLMPLVFAITFTVTTLEVRRGNWTTMPRMVAAAAGVFAADRLIVWSEPIWRVLG